MLGSGTLVLCAELSVGRTWGSHAMQPCHAGRLEVCYFDALPCMFHVLS